MMDFEDAAIRIGAEYVAKCARRVSEKAKEYCTDKEIRESVTFSSDGLCAQVSATATGAISQELGSFKKGAEPFLSRAAEVLKEGII